jgi:hypothetical protein
VNERTLLSVVLIVCIVVVSAVSIDLADTTHFLDIVVVTIGWLTVMVIARLLIFHLERSED